MSDSWYIKTRSGKRGPFSIEKLQQFVDAKVLLPNAGVSDGGERWVAAKSIASLDFSRAAAEPADDALAARRRQIDELEQEWHAKHAEWESRNAALQATESSLHAREVDLQRQAESLQQQTESLERQAESLQQQAETLAAQQQSIESEAETVKRDREELVAQRTELSQHEADWETRQAELQSQHEATLQREQELIAREESIQQQQQQLENRQREAERVQEETDELNAEKKKLLAEFAARQESLSQREAELARREEELLRRELAIVDDEASPQDASSGQVSDSNPKPKPQRVVASNAKRKTIRTEVVSAAVSETPASSPPVSETFDDEDPLSAGEAVAENAEAKPKKVWVRPSQHQEADLADGQLAAFRNNIYESRFGPCTQYLEDDDGEIKIDVSVHEPSGTREFTTMVTSGLSDYPIASSSGGQSVRAELLLYVTHDDALAIDTLRSSAKIPVRKQAGISIGMTETLNLGEGTPVGYQQTDSVLMLPVIESDSKTLAARELTGGSIQLFWLVTITKAERRLIESSGIHKFLSLMETNNHAVFFDLSRDCFVKRKGWFR